MQWFIKGLRGLKEYDLFKQTISFTYKGREGYATYPGMILTTIITVIILVNAYTQFSIMFAKSNINFTQGTTRMDSLSEISNYTFDEDTAKLGIRWTLDNGSSLDNLYYQVLAYHYIDKVFDNSSEREIVQLIEKTCTDDYFPWNFKGVDVYAAYGFHCFDLNNLTVNSNRDAAIQSYITFEVFVCRGDPNCPDDGEFLDHLESSYLQLYFMNSYIDASDVETPIKRYLDETVVSPYNYNFLQLINLNIRRNLYELQDSIWPWQQKVEGDFASYVENSQAVSTVADSQFAYKIRLELDPNINYYNREVLNLLEVTGILGGLFEIMYKVTSIVFGIYVSRRLESKQIIKIVQDQTELYKNQKGLNAKNSHKNSNVSPDKKEMNGKSILKLGNDGDVSYVSKLIDMKTSSTHCCFCGCRNKAVKATIEDFKHYLDPTNVVFEIQRLRQDVDHLLNFNLNLKQTSTEYDKEPANEERKGHRNKFFENLNLNNKVRTQKETNFQYNEMQEELKEINPDVSNIICRDKERYSSVPESGNFQIRNKLNNMISMQKRRSEYSRIHNYKV